MLDKIIGEVAKSIITKVGTGLASVAGQVKIVSDSVASIHDTISTIQSNVDQVNQRVQAIVPDALAQLSDADLATAIDNIVTQAIAAVQIGPQVTNNTLIGTNGLIGENGLIGTNGLIGENGTVALGK